MKLKSIILLGTFASFSLSCSDFLEPEDNEYVKGDQLQETVDMNSDAIVQGVYSRSVQYGFGASRHDDFGQRSIDISCDMMTEDIVHYTNKQWFSADYNLDNRAATYTRSLRQWKYCYAQIRDLNSIIDIYPNDNELNEEQRHLKGESLALRAFHYFTLVNIYQKAGKWADVKDLPGVPVYTTVGLEGNPRGKVSDVYDQIKADYTNAIALLEGDDYDKTRVGQLAAKALYARAAMFYEDYATAEKMASDVIAATSLMSTSDYTAGFADMANIEWLWAVDVTSENTTSYASFFSIMDNLSPGYAGSLGQYKCVDRRLYDANDAKDIRKQCFKDGTYKIPYMQFKFVDPSKKFLGDLVYLRCAEAYYIKAEAQARQGNISGAQTTLNTISAARSTDGECPYKWSANVDELINQIFLHKRIELWGEGQSLFEFNRLEKTIDRTYAGTNHPKGNITAEGGDQPVPWSSKIRVIQIPTKEIEGNPEISETDQN